MGRSFLRLAATIAVGLAVAGSARAQQPQLPVLDVNIEEAVRQRLERDPGDFFQNGTGFVIANGELVVTSAHVVAGCRDLRVIDPTGVESNATLLVWDGRRDVAVLRLRNRYFGGLRLRSPVLDRRGRERDPPRLVHPIGFVMSFGTGSSPRARQVYLGEPAQVLVRAFPSERDPSTGAVREQVYEMLRFGVPLEPGASGAPVLNEEGEVVGLVTALSDGMTLGTSLRDIARAVQGAGYPPFEEGPAPRMGDPSDYVVKTRCR